MNEVISISELLQIGIVGAGLSLALELIQRLTKTNGIWMKALTLLLALLVGTGYVYLRNSPYWTTIIVILGAASIVYAILIPKSGASSEPAV